MKLLNICLATVLGGMLLGSCTPEPQILEFDETFNPKAPTKGKRDALPPIDLLNMYASFKQADSKVLVKMIKGDNDEIIVQDVSPLTISVRLSKPAEKPIKLTLATMTNENTPEKYGKIVRGSVLAIAEGTYTIENKEITIDAGQQESSFNIQFHKDELKKLDVKGEYVLPLIIVPENKDVIVPNVHVVRFSVLMSEVLPTGDNVEESQEISDPWSWISGNSLKLSSNYQSSHLWKLNDGKEKGENWWIDTRQPSIWLGVSIAEPKLIKGFMMYGDSFTMEVLASNDGGASYVSQGTITLNYGRMHVVKFIKPIKIDALKFQNFKSGSQWRNIYELKLISE